MLTAKNYWSRDVGSSDSPAYQADSAYTHSVFSSKHRSIPMSKSINDLKKLCIGKLRAIVRLSAEPYIFVAKYPMGVNR